MTGPTRRLKLDPRTVRKARRLAGRAAAPVIELARTSTTVSVERAVLRLAGLAGADAAGIPGVNRLVDAGRADVGLEHGVALPVWDALLREQLELATLAEKAAAGGVRFQLPTGRDRTKAMSAARRCVATGVRTIDRNRQSRDRLTKRLGDPAFPWIYLIVATGDIDEDVPQAQAAAREGADVI